VQLAYCPAVQAWHSLPCNLQPTWCDAAGPPVVDPGSDSDSCKCKAHAPLSQQERSPSGMSCSAWRGSCATATAQHREGLVQEAQGRPGPGGHHKAHAPLMDAAATNADDSNVWLLLRDVELLPRQAPHLVSCTSYPWLPCCSLLQRRGRGRLHAAQRTGLQCCGEAGSTQCVHVPTAGHAIMSRDC
jgi:hypothetical protein